MFDVALYIDPYMSDRFGEGHTAYYSEVVPDLIAHIRAVLSGDDDADELIDRVPNPSISPYAARDMYVNWARALPDEAFDLALTPRQEFDNGDPRLQLRAEALTLIRKWFTRAYKNLPNRAGGIYWPKDEHYRM